MERVEGCEGGKEAEPYLPSEEVLSEQINQEYKFNKYT